MNVFLVILLVAIGLLFVYEGFMLVRTIIKRRKERKSKTKPTPRVSNSNVQRKE